MVLFPPRAPAPGADLGAKNDSKKLVADRIVPLVGLAGATEGVEEREKSGDVLAAEVTVVGAGTGRMAGSRKADVMLAVAAASTTAGCIYFFNGAIF